MKYNLHEALTYLGKEFDQIEWNYAEVPSGSFSEKMQLWPGSEEEDIMICVYKGTEIHELFHRQDYFFFNFAYLGDYGALSYRFDNQLMIHEGECYISQPFAGYALRSQSNEEIIIIGILIQKERFFKTFLPILSANAKLFHFFLDANTNAFSDEFIHLSFDDDSEIRALLEIMVVEYANKQTNTDHILSSLTVALLMMVARQYTISNKTPISDRLSEQIVQYIWEHSDAVTLKDIAKFFSYHPNYISNLLHRETGKTFSEILLEKRMERAIVLLKGTTLSIEEIAIMLGYNNSSNFYRTFKYYYGQSPRDYLAEKK
ncbi:MAG: helix-turn-helix transcriptional regulator [Lachnospiraceae bacterium]|nr:helix-turn-helix transcriptional regulator [Lachnospiraceae bacterium]